MRRHMLNLIPNTLNKVYDFLWTKNFFVDFMN